MRTKIVKWGNSQGIRLPRFLLEGANLSDNDAVEVTAEGDRIIIKKTDKPRKTIQELFEGYDGEYEPVEVNWGQPRGKEIW